MHKHLTLVFATLALSAAAFAQSDAPYQLGYAANLNIGDAEVNISNDGARAASTTTTRPTSDRATSASTCTCLIRLKKKLPAVLAW